MSKYLIMAGGTGGHIFPALAVARKIQQLGHEVVWLGSNNAMETRIVPQNNIELVTIKIKGVRGNGLKRKLVLPFSLVNSIYKVISVIKKQQIKGVVGFGGFVSFPGGVAAKLCGIPLIIHEQNAVAGLSNKLLAKIANKTFFAFPNVFPNLDGLIGNPIRKDIATVQKPDFRFSIRIGALKMLVVGGSLGAQFFNEKIPELLAKIPVDLRPVIRHQCGKGNLEKVANRYAALGVEAECIEFIDDIKQEYEKADFVICRAGALTVSELAAVGLGGYLIPYPFAVDDHQTYNAQYLVAGGAVKCIQQADLSIDELAQEIAQLNRSDCLQWANQARALALLDADTKIATALIKLSHDKVKTQQ